jgi:hypothetical protein
MNSLLVLGLIPGTNIQIGFVAWAILGVILTGTYFIIRARRPHRVIIVRCRPDTSLRKLDAIRHLAQPASTTDHKDAVPLKDSFALW